MTQLAAICNSLLDGQVLSIMTGFKMFSCTNLPRELSRGVEQKFGVLISKERVEFTSKYGQKGTYFRYRLNKTKYNKDGMDKMKAYVSEQRTSFNPKTTKQLKAL
jgi:hypothetical protein